MRTPTSTPVPLLGVLLGAVLAVTGCGASGSNDADAREPATSRALAAVASRHVSVEPVLIAPLGTDQEVVEPAVGVELAMPRGFSDNAHLDLVVVPAGALADRYWRESRCVPADPRCEESAVEESDGGGEMVLYWQPEAVESDPGIVRVVVRHDDGSLTTAGFNGPPIPRGRPDDLVVMTLDDLVALTVDPDARTTTSAEAVAAGEEISDDVWLDWFGQGNGAPSPSS